MRVLRTLVIAASTLVPACAPSASHVKPTTALIDAAPKAAAALIDATPKEIELYTPAQRAALEKVHKKGQTCRKTFEECTKPEFICRRDMDACAYQTVVDLRI